MTPSSSAVAEVEGLGLGFWVLRMVEECAEEAALGRVGALPKESGKKARIASSSISPPSAMELLAAGEVGSGGSGREMCCARLRAGQVRVPAQESCRVFPLMSVWFVESFVWYEKYARSVI